MTDYIERWLRDEKEISKNQWNELFDKDLKEENKEHTWDITSAVYTDLRNGRDIDLNGHLYQTKTDMVYDSAKELLDDLLYYHGEYDIITDAIQHLTEEELLIIFSKSERVNIENGKFIFKDVE